MAGDRARLSRNGVGISKTRFIGTLAKHATESATLAPSIACQMINGNLDYPASPMILQFVEGAPLQEFLATEQVLAVGSPNRASVRHQIGFPRFGSFRLGRDRPKRAGWIRIRQGGRAARSATRPNVRSIPTYTRNLQKKHSFLNRIPILA